MQAASSLSSTMVARSCGPAGSPTAFSRPSPLSRCRPQSHLASTAATVWGSACHQDRAGPVGTWRRAPIRDSCWAIASSITSASRLP